MPVLPRPLLALLLLVLPGVAAAPAAAQSAPTNFVVILSDDQRFDTLSWMPIVQAELVARGVNFTDALVTTPLCCPVRASFLSGGFLSQRTGVRHNLLPNGGVTRFLDAETIATRLQSAGYATALMGKYMNGYEGIGPYIPPGWTTFLAHYGSTLLPNFAMASGSSTPTAPGFGTDILGISQYGTDYLRDRALDFIDAHAADPFFLYLAMDAPHHPANPAPGDENLFPGYLYRGRGYGETDLSDKPLRIRSAAALFPGIAAEVDEFNLKQLRSLQALDRAVGAIVARLETLGLLERTIVFYMSDNGFLWGEHGLQQKGEVYEESIRVPLVVVAPGVTPRTDDRLVAADLDVAATILDYAGIPLASDGLSLAPVLGSPASPARTSILVEAQYDTQSWAALRVRDARGDWKYVEHTRGEKELYDLASDPYELQSLHASTSLAPLRAELAAELAPLKGLASTTHFAVPAKVNRPYTLSLRAWGGTPPYTWTLSEGTLPAGFSLDSAAGMVSGTPTRPESQSVIFAVEDQSTDSLGNGGRQIQYQPLTLRVVTDCDDKLDNDGDGLVDLADLGCANATWPRENPECDDGVDNDGDGGVDWDGGAGAPPDPQCTAPYRRSESAARACGLGFELAFLIPLLYKLRRRALG
jgi:arylsulfatase A-like enzyme